MGGHHIQQLIDRLVERLLAYRVIGLRHFIEPEWLEKVGGHLLKPRGLLLAMKGPQARALVPQLAMAGITAQTRVATSQITSGTGKASEDVLLDGIVHPTESWGARSVPGLPSQASAAARLDTAKGPAARLFAFGFDAWLLTAYLERLALSANADIDGATGRLSLDGFGNVLRQPSWSRYSGGVPVPLGDAGR